MPSVKENKTLHSSLYEEDFTKMPYHQRTSVHSNGYSTDEQNGNGEESPTYVMEHLATFTVSKETSIVYPADGMRRLLQLEKSNGIWSQKMQLRLDRSWVLIMDYETGAVMERFPASLIQEPTAFTSNDPMEIYNNILVFIVGEERQSSSHSEMHIFQCQSISAQELVEDLKLLRVGKSLGGRKSQHIPPPPPTPPPDPPMNGVNVREQVSVFNAVVHQPEGHSGSELGGAVIVRDDETSSTSSEKYYERDVNTLNRCFDDIEKFIARLQHAAAASRELERRRRSRKSKKKDMGDGLLTMRAKPPPEVEFIDIFQKFKLSFNLLAKLKHHIHDPNAPELVHFLFTPLALIVNASHDTQYGPNLPSKVVSPLLTQEAVNLLINCVTSKETELWHALGDAWLIPRDQWKGYVSPYHPLFMDGSSPDYPVLADREPVGMLGPAVASEAKRTRGDEIRAAQHEAELREAQYHREREPEDSHYSGDYLYDQYERQETSPTDVNRYGYDNRNFTPRQESILYNRDEREHSMSPGGSDPDFPKALVTSPRDRDHSTRSDISADSIERNSGVASAGGPERFERVQAKWLEELRNNGSKIVQVTYPRTANNDKELTVIRGEFLEVLDDNRKWWKARNSRGQVAHVPNTIVTPLAAGNITEPGDVFSNPLYTRGYDHYQQQESGRGDLPPAPPPAPVEWVRNQRLGKKDSEDEEIIQRTHDVEPISPNSDYSYVNELSDADSVRLELQEVLMAYKKKPNWDFLRTPTVYITSKSTDKDVQQWLQQKSFNERSCNQLKSMNGEEIFNLTKTQLEQLCGREEGKRLYSQLLIQRSESGWTTRRSAELCEKLARARLKAEQDIEEQKKLQKENDNTVGDNIQHHY
uniref:SH3 domain-containing protein n=1 Tax=Clastoptera arizonana TaxID=38151 RepID=A0A1B6CXT1_9HEMI